MNQFLLHVDAINLTYNTTRWNSCFWLIRSFRMIRAVAITHAGNSMDDASHSWIWKKTCNCGNAKCFIRNPLYNIFGRNLLCKHFVSISAVLTYGCSLNFFQNLQGGGLWSLVSCIAFLSYQFEEWGKRKAGKWMTDFRCSCSSMANGCGVRGANPFYSSKTALQWKVIFLS